MGKQKTTEQFIKESITKHGDKYDYSKVVYTKKDNKVIIICKRHGDFEQCANSHLLGYGCQKCGGNYRYDTNGFIDKSKLIHGDTYDYSLTNYKNNQTKVIIICKTHGGFEQQPCNHLQGNGCPDCKGDRVASKRKKPIDQFIKEAIEKHGNKYDYSNVIYKNGSTKITICCKEHGEFLQTPSHHLRGQGCIKCTGKYTLTQNLFIDRAKNIHSKNNEPVYDYSNTCFINNQTPIVILCSKHGEYNQMPYLHLNGHGCQKCGWETSDIKKQKREKIFIERAIQIYGDLYDYANVKYNGSNLKVEIKCKQHGSFYKTPDNHIHKNYPQGCPYCVNKTETKLYEKLLPLYPTLIIQYKQEWCKKLKHLPFDFCIPEYKIIIELDGPQHFQQISNWSSPEEQFENDKYKEKCANDNEYSVIRILQEDVFYDTYDWCKELCETIEEIKNGDEIANVYLCKNNEYDIF